MVVGFCFFVRLFVCLFWEPFRPTDTCAMRPRPLVSVSFAISSLPPPRQLPCFPFSPLRENIRSLRVCCSAREREQMAICFTPSRGKEMDFIPLLKGRPYFLTTHRMLVRP